MGAKTAVLAYADAEIAHVLQDAPTSEIGRAAALVARVRPRHRIDTDTEEAWELADALYPPEGTVCALSASGLDLVCDRVVMLDRPSQLPEHLVAAGRGRRLYLHAMHSVVDWLAFAVWDNGTLVRSLSLSPDSGIIEDIGERFPFEQPYWEGRHPVEPLPPFEDDEPYPLPFHPLALGERAMLEFFGFCVEGFSGEDDAPEPVVDIWDVELHGFRVTATSSGEGAD
ncbi:DUF6928 family protein [Streptomyces griseomycini]|uniref:Uncharacterized protein n=1 Tax=Streptomyces griseomycini TaxID=66895 RepID=A0A7W7PR67_9ACTN|nr:hypothetical protein [Streptomyces griseomycini]MBB4899314.1 hypothetical protein [Streptomyces griseomycini]GGQ27982.1 hypothetical protein GCM10010266_59090 [Streptomyces griseomycini]GGR35481.1 hypothetical protein GCM10015536_46450 [Streptomyces griseomycini]